MNSGGMNLLPSRHNSSETRTFSEMGSYDFRMLGAA
jgi:hypothetical protein